MARTSWLLQRIFMSPRLRGAALVAR